MNFPSITMASWIKGGGFLGISLIFFRHSNRFRLDSAISTESRSYGTQFTHRFCAYEKTRPRERLCIGRISEQSSVISSQIRGVCVFVRSANWNSLSCN